MNVSALFLALWRSSTNNKISSVIYFGHLFPCLYLSLVCKVLATMSVIFFHDCVRSSAIFSVIWIYQFLIAGDLYNGHHIEHGLKARLLWGMCKLGWLLSWNFYWWWIYLVPYYILLWVFDIFVIFMSSAWQYYKSRSSLSFLVLQPCPTRSWHWGFV